MIRSGGAESEGEEEEEDEGLLFLVVVVVAVVLLDDDESRACSSSQRTVHPPLLEYMSSWRLRLSRSMEVRSAPRMQTETRRWRLRRWRAAARARAPDL